MSANDCIAVVVVVVVAYLVYYRLVDRPAEKFDRCTMNRYMERPGKSCCARPYPIPQLHCPTCPDCHPCRPCN